jgi:hypothetical protein
MFAAIGRTDQRPGSKVSLPAWFGADPSRDGQKKYPTSAATGAATQVRAPASSCGQVLPAPFKMRPGAPSCGLPADLPDLGRHGGNTAARDRSRTHRAGVVGVRRRAVQTPASQFAEHAVWPCGIVATERTEPASGRALHRPPGKYPCVTGHGRWIEFVGRGKHLNPAPHRRPHRGGPAAGADRSTPGSGRGPPRPGGLLGSHAAHGRPEVSQCGAHELRLVC